MVTATRVRDAIASHFTRYGERPSTLDVAIALNVTPQHVRRVVAELVAAGIVRRVGSGPATRLVAQLAPENHSDVLLDLLEAARAQAPHCEIERLAIAALQAVRP